jgi:hypothetical protein
MDARTSLSNDKREKQIVQPSPSRLRQRYSLRGCNVVNVCASFILGVESVERAKANQNFFRGENVHHRPREVRPRRGCHCHRRKFRVRVIVDDQVQSALLRTRKKISQDTKTKSQTRPSRYNYRQQREVKCEALQQNTSRVLYPRAQGPIRTESKR